MRALRVWTSTSCDLDLLQFAERGQRQMGKLLRRFKIKNKKAKDNHFGRTPFP